MICSIIGFVNKSRGKDYIHDRSGGNLNKEGHVWSSSVIAFGQFVHILFEVCGGIFFWMICNCIYICIIQNTSLNVIIKSIFFIVIGTAVLVTVINYSVIDSSCSFWNLSQHFITLVTLILELFLNNMYIRADHYPFNMSWALLYLIFIWPLVAMNRIPSYPYPFLATDTSLCFFYYFSLFVVDALVYYTFYSLSYLKFLFSRISFCELGEPISPYYSGDNFEHGGGVATERSLLNEARPYSEISSHLTTWRIS
jgi:hypothetical protein